MAISAGPKAKITADDLDLSGLSTQRAKRRLDFIAKYVITPRGHGAGKPMRMRAFQKEIVRGCYAKGIRTGLVSIPRANGKTALAAALGLAEMVAGAPSAEVLIVASTQQQAAITMKLATRMIELSPELSERFQIFRDRIYFPQNDATMIPLPAEAAALHGYDPSLLIVDELHVVTREVWEAVTSMTGKRPESLTLAVSTPSGSTDSIMWDLVKHGREGLDPAFYIKEYSAPEGCALDDRAAWRIANPALDCRPPFLAEDGMLAAMKTLREPIYRQLRLGQWVSGIDSWLPHGEWDELAAPRTVGKRERVVLAFDGSASGDSTAIMGVTVGENPYVFRVAVWSNPGDKRWRVPREEVDQMVNKAFAQYNVVEFACDPWGWRTEVEAWAKRHGERRVIEWNTAAAQRMAPATDRLYQAVATGDLSHDGDPEVSSHFAHCIAKPTPMGDLVSKDKKGSPRKIDAAVAAIVAFDRAAFHASKGKKARSFSE